MHYLAFLDVKPKQSEISYSTVKDIEEDRDRSRTNADILKRFDVALMPPKGQWIQIREGLFIRLTIDLVNLKIDKRCFYLLVDFFPPFIN